MIKAHANTAFSPLGSLLLLVWLCLLTGCFGGEYYLKGRVISDRQESLTVHDEDDPKLERNGLDGVEIRIVVDPDRMHPTPYGPVYTDDNGWFELKVDKRGAGFLFYETEFLARRGGYDSVVERLGLPGKKQGLLVRMREGADTYIAPVDEIQESLDVLKRMDAKYDAK